MQNMDQDVMLSPDGWSTDDGIQATEIIKKRNSFSLYSLCFAAIFVVCLKYSQFWIMFHLTPLHNHIAKRERINMSAIENNKQTDWY